VSAYAFDNFVVDAGARRVTRGGEIVPIPDRHVGVLLHLLAHAGSLVSKDQLIESAWEGLAVTDNSLEQAISGLRRVLGGAPGGTPYIQTVPRQGYRFTGIVTRTTVRASDDSLDALLAPHRAWIEGRAALETLAADQIVRARGVFERVLSSAPDQASAHVGLANACIMQFEMTRADESPDTAALALAAQHAREACRLGPDYGEAWATLGFVLDRTGRHTDALAASRRAVTLEADNWRHHLRLAYVSWGEERLREARRTLALLPGFPLAHWLCATVHVARQALDEAERELDAGITGQANQQSGPWRFSSVALHWLRGLLHLARGDERRAVESFQRELSFEASGHLYARECCANTWYALGALHRRYGRETQAGAAFQQALSRVPRHPLAGVGLGIMKAETVGAGLNVSAPSFEAAIGRAAGLAAVGDHADAARLVDQALAAAPPSNAGWLLPVEPMLNVVAAPDIWAPVLARLRTRAA
jgi:DNA-binding winged helix-turn-helix (wHTH) protein/cytochrome c-type biogenesis protein CcmH/NrfG